jgi:hypothetical protein
MGRADKGGFPPPSAWHASPPEDPCGQKICLRRLIGERFGEHVKGVVAGGGADLCPAQRAEVDGVGSGGVARLRKAKADAAFRFML